MTETNHTPLPWNLAADGEGILSEFQANPRRPITRMFDTRLDGLSREENEANAAYIVQCCNAYPKLVAVLKQVQWDSYNDPDYGTQVFCPICRNERKYGHRKDCELADALRAAGEEL